MRTERETVIQTARAMLEKACSGLRDVRLEKRVVLSRIELATFEESDAFFQDRHITGRREVVDGGIRKPNAIIGDARANALSGRRQPPVLHIALQELATRGPQQMLASECGLRHYQRHSVLQLVAKPVSATRLIERRACPDATHERLIEQPTIEHQIHGAIRRL